MELWPWAVSPLTARVLLGWAAVFSIVNLYIAFETRWSAARIPIQSLMIWFGLMLLGFARAWSDVDASNPVLWVLLGGVVVYLVGLSALYVRFRDVRHVVPFLLQIWLFATPIAYPSSLLTEPWRTLYALNPMVGVVEGFRWALLGADTAPGLLILVSTAIALAVLVSGAYFFRHVEGTFADIV
jgi:lipopolysaccharide transport system permease protein